CLSYIHQFAHCVLLGNFTSTLMCTIPSVEMVKKTDKATCTENIPEKPIKASYIQHPNTTTGKIFAIDTSKAILCGNDLSIIDATLPDNSSKLLGNTPDTKLTWDNQLGSWMLSEGSLQIYVRAAQCIKPLDSE
ncbi:hypothetical protein PMAYCL1PPCAC_25393, partial [Pristionchus mayeri]